MKEPLTEELLGELLEAPDPAAFIDAHPAADRTLSGYLNELLAQKGLERADVIHAADLNETYGYQIFMGQRKPSRNKVLQIVFALGLDLREANSCLDKIHSYP